MTDRPEMPCRACDGTGRTLMTASQAVVFDALGIVMPRLAPDIAIETGLSNQRTVGVLQELRAAGLAKRLGRTAQGFEWVLTPVLHRPSPPAKETKP